MTDLEVRSLTGLSGVHVVIGDLSGAPEAEEGNAAFRREAYRVVEGALRQAGIPILPTFEDVVLAADHGLLSFAVNFVGREETEFLAITAQTRLAQPALLSRSANSPAATAIATHVTTWAKVSTGLVNPAEFASAVGEVLQWHALTFAQDFQAANGNGAVSD